MDFNAVWGNLWRERSRVHLPFKPNGWVVIPTAQLLRNPCFLLPMKSHREQKQALNNFESIGPNSWTPCSPVWKPLVSALCKELQDTESRGLNFNCLTKWCKLVWFMNQHTDVCFGWWFIHKSWTEQKCRLCSFLREGLKYKEDIPHCRALTSF